MEFDQQNQPSYQVPSYDCCNHENKKLPGFRFTPTDAELIVHYLRRKFEKKILLPGTSKVIHQADIYKYSPKDLTGQYPGVEDEKSKENWYFFTPRERKYYKGLRPARNAGNGYWKATGADKDIKDNTEKIIGHKRSLVFYIGKAPEGTKTDWHQKEYRITQKPIEPTRLFHGDMKLDDSVLCHIYLNKKSTKKTPTSDQRKKAKKDDNVNSQEEQQDIGGDIFADDFLNLFEFPELGYQPLNANTGQNPFYGDDSSYNTGLIEDDQWMENQILQDGQWMDSVLEANPGLPLPSQEGTNDFPVVHDNIQNHQGSSSSSSTI